MGSSNILYTQNKIKEKQFGLIDCNNFFVSCERVFNPSLRNKPVIVLSNNDGCIVSRSEEVKALKIPMGAPIFKYKDQIEKYNIKLFSSNFELYQDMSNRVMNIIKNKFQEIEPYSIDEAFVCLNNISIKDVNILARNLKETIYNSTNIPVSIGIGQTKTLAKIATKTAKTDSSLSGVCNLFDFTKQEVDANLSKIDIQEIWGIGFRSAYKLRMYGINNARDLKYTDKRFLKNMMGVSGERIILELNKISCFVLNKKVENRQSIISSRSFSKYIEDIEELKESVITYTARGCEKLREQESVASSILVYIKTNKHSKTLPQYGNSYEIKFDFPTNDTSTIIKYGITALEKIYKMGFKYKKAGISLGGIQSNESIQTDLFKENSIDNVIKQSNLNKCIDSLNRKFFTDKVIWASQGIKKESFAKQSLMSARYTTKLEEIMLVK